MSSHFLISTAKISFIIKLLHFVRDIRLPERKTHLNWVQEELEFWGKSNQWTDGKHLSTWADVSEHKVIIHWLSAVTFAVLQGYKEYFPAFFRLVYFK